MISINVCAFGALLIILELNINMDRIRKKTLIVVKLQGIF